MASLNRHLRVLLLLIVVISLAACRRQQADAGPTAAPTITPTPRSTPLPEIATDVPPGAEENPLRLLVRLDVDPDRARSAATDVERLLAQQASLTVDVQLVERDAEALSALCGASGASKSAVWLNGLAYEVALARNCGEPVLMLERGTGSDARTGDSSVLLVAKDSKITSVPGLKDADFCRVSFDDLYSWLVPALMLKSAGLDPAASLKSTADHDTLASALAALEKGDCDVVGASRRAYQQALDRDPDAMAGVRLLATSVEVPYGLLVIPTSLPLDVRRDLIEGIANLAETSRTAPTLRGLIGQNALRSVSADDLKELTDFVRSSGFDLVQLGE